MYKCVFAFVTMCMIARTIVCTRIDSRALLQSVNRSMSFEIPHNYTLLFSVPAIADIRVHVRVCVHVSMYVTHSISHLRGISVQYGDKYSALRPSIFRSEYETSTLPIPTVALDEEGQVLGFNPPPKSPPVLVVGSTLEVELDGTRTSNPIGGVVFDIE